MFDYFFTPENQLPENVGFSMFGSVHFGILGAVALLSACMLVWFRKQPGSKQDRVMVISAGVMIGSEIVKDFILAVIGAFSVGYLPLHLCSLAMFTCLFYSAHPHNRSCGQIMYSVCFPGALCALLFPDWTDFPIMHFQSIHSFFVHTLLVQFSLFPLVSGRCRPGWPGIWKSIVFLTAAAVPVAGLNYLLHTNYMFLSHPSKGSPLEFLAGIPGRYGYLVGFFLLALGVVCLLNLPFCIYNAWKKRRNAL